MKHYYQILAAICLIISTSSIAQTEWIGPPTTFTKIGFTDFTLPENQDALTDNVILTRANNRGLFNIAQEAQYDNINDTSPIDTEWAVGTIADGVETLTFDTWHATHGGNPPSLVNVDTVLHLISDDIYIDVRLLSWAVGGGSGGGFSYQRSTDQNLSIDEFAISNRIMLTPNPTKNTISLNGLNGTHNYKIYNLVGSQIASGVIENKQTISVENLIKGVYIIKLDGISTLKFVKD